MSDNGQEKQVLFEIKQLCKSFGPTKVLDHIDATIRQGEVVVIVGPSGSGKSTFLRSLNLLEMPTSGEILFEGKEITDPKSNLNQYRQKIGMVFQHFNLFANKTILENMTLAPIKVLKKSKAEAEKEAMELLARVRARLRRRSEPVPLLSRMGPLELDRERHEVRVNGSPVALTRKEYELLRLLMDHPRAAFDRDQLLERVWGYVYAGETRTVDVHVRTLRQKLGEAASCIETVRGVGYRLAAEWSPGGLRHEDGPSPEQIRTDTDTSGGRPAGA